MNDLPNRRGCLGLGVEHIPGLVAHVPEAEYNAINNAAAELSGGFEAKRKALFNRLVPHALDGIRARTRASCRRSRP